MDDTETIPQEPFTRYVAERLFTKKGLERMLAEGRVRPVLTGVFVDAAVEDTIELRCRALSLVVARHTVICDLAAAWLLGIDCYRYRDHEILPPIDAFALRGRRRVERSQVKSGERDLSPRDIIELHGLTLTSPLRTVLDLACKLPRYRALAALDAFMRHYGLTHEQMWNELKRYRRRRGVVQARELVLKADPGAESERESWTRLAILDSGLPKPVLQHPILEHGREIFRLDLAYPKLRIAIEYDGEEFHDRTDDQREYDEQRRDWLRRHGWIVIVVTKDGFTNAGRQVWLNELRQALWSRR